MQAIEDARSVLNAVADEFEAKPESWCQINVGKTSEGKSVQWIDQEAVSWCALGKLQAVAYRGRSLKDALTMTDECMTLLYDRLQGKTLISFNDREGRVVGEVVDLFRKAAR